MTTERKLALTATSRQRKVAAPWLNFMKNTLFLLLSFSTFACSSNHHRDPKTGSTTELIKSDSLSQWKIFSDTIETLFTISFKYPDSLYAERFQNGFCIGKPIKQIDDAPGNSMDCAIWMEEQMYPIDTLITSEIKSLKRNVDQKRENIFVSGSKALKVTLFDKGDTNRVEKQMIYLKKGKTFFEIINDRLSPQDFSRLSSSIKIEH